MIAFHRFAPQSSYLQSYCSHECQPIAVRDDPRTHRVIEMQLAAGETIAEVDVNGARKPIRNGGQAQVVRGHKPNRPGSQ